MTCWHMQLACQWGSPSFLWLDCLAAFWKIGRWLDCINIRSAFSQQERRSHPLNMSNFVSTHKQQNTPQLTTIMKIAVCVNPHRIWCQLTYLHVVTLWDTELRIIAWRKFLFCNKYPAVQTEQHVTSVHTTFSSVYIFWHNFVSSSQVNSFNYLLANCVVKAEKYLDCSSEVWTEELKSEYFYHWRSNRLIRILLYTTATWNVQWTVNQSDSAISDPRSRILHGHLITQVSASFVWFHLQY